MSLIPALDGGATSVKGALLDLPGSMLSLCAHEYHLDSPAPDIVELGGEVYWSAAKAVIADILKETAVPPETITDLGVMSQGEILIVLDKQGRSLRKAIVWQDNRARAGADIIKNEFGRDLFHANCEAWWLIQFCKTPQQGECSIWGVPFWTPFGMMKAHDEFKPFFVRSEGPPEPLIPTEDFKKSDVLKNSDCGRCTYGRC